MAKLWCWCPILPLGNTWCGSARGVYITTSTNVFFNNPRTHTLDFAMCLGCCGCGCSSRLINNLIAYV